jgi:glycosyltransferase involved in cell wall biosynthesis
MIGTPNKLFEAMACGVPSIVPKFPEMEKIINEEGIGLSVDSTKEKVVAKEILRLLREPERIRSYSANALRASKETYNWKRMEDRLVAVYERKIK